MKNKIALITGGGRGLGKDMALSLAKKGIDVIITYNNKMEDADKVAAEIITTGQMSASLKFDVSDIQSIDNFIKQLSETLKTKFNSDRFDFLINIISLVQYRKEEIWKSKFFSKIFIGGEGID